MGLISYESLEDGTPITANIFNERFGQIVAELNGKLDQLNFAAGGIPAAALAPGVFEKIYPIGSLYFNSVDNTNPSELLGFGTWTAFAAGRVPVGYDSTQTEFNAAEKTGGHKSMQSHTHTGTTSSAGNHKHVNYDNLTRFSGGTSEVGLAAGGSKYLSAATQSSAGAHTHSFTTASSGTGDSGNLQPFITVYIWKRTA